MYHYPSSYFSLVYSLQFPSSSVVDHYLLGVVFYSLLLILCIGNCISTILVRFGMFLLLLRGSFDDNCQNYLRKIIVIQLYFYPLLYFNIKTLLKSFKMIHTYYIIQNFLPPFVQKPLKSLLQM